METATIQRQKYTPPQLARLWGCATETILAHIRSGELRAVDVVTPGHSRRPRYKIDVADIAIFEQRREVRPAPTKPRRVRKRRDDGITGYY
jgi:hypothetical protein